jgi:hypothetical protein
MHSVMRPNFVYGIQDYGTPALRASYANHTYLYGMVLLRLDLVHPKLCEPSEYRVSTKRIASLSQNGSIQT